MNARRLVSLLAGLNDRRTEQDEHVHDQIRTAFARPQVDEADQVVDNPLAPYPGLDLTPANLGSERIVR